MLIQDSFLVYEDLGYSISSPNLLKDLENIRINLNKKIEEEFLNKQNNIKIINMEDKLYQNIENIIFGVQVNYLKLETDDVYEKRIDIFFENHFKNNLNKYLSFNTINDDYIVLILKDINENIVIEHKLFYTNIVKNKEKILERLEEKLNVFYGLSYLDSLILNKILKD